MEATILALQEYMSQRTHPQGKTDGNVTVKPNKKKKKKGSKSPLFWLLKVLENYTFLIALCLTIQYVNNSSHKELIIQKQ